MRAVLRTGLVALSGTGLVLAAVHFPDVHYRMAGSGAAVTATTPAAGLGLRPVTSAALVCPGPESVGVKGVDAKTAAAPVVLCAAFPPPDLLPVTGSTTGPTTGVTSGATTGAVSGTAIGTAGDPTFPPLAAPGTTASAKTSSASSVLLSAKGSLAPGLVAAQTSLVTSGDLRGLSSATCQAPTGDTWLVGGAGTTGRRARVILTNPSPTAVTVDLDVFGTKGQVTAAAGRGIVVPAMARSVVLLDAIAPHEKAPVIHVEASGGLVSATLSDGLLSGTTPAGSDDVVGTTPGRHLVIPGVATAGTAGSTVLRIASTGRAARVQLRVLTATGPTEAPVKGGLVKVAAHRAKNVDLSSLAVGAVAIELSANVPVVAGVQLQRGDVAGRALGDLAWTSAQPAVTALAGLPLAANTAPWANRLVLTAATRDAALDVVSIAPGGTPTSMPVSIEAGTTKIVAVTGTPDAVWLRVHSGAVNAAVITTYADPAGQLLSVLPLSQPTLQVHSVAVHAQAG